MIESLKQVDWVTNTLWMLFYSVALLLFLGLFWRDYINDFRKQNATYRREEVLVSETHKQYTTILTQKGNYENSNMAALNKIHNVLSSTNLQSMFSQSSGGVVVKNIASKTPPPVGMQENHFQISGIVKNTRELKGILQSLQNSQYAIEISFPIQFEKTKKGLKYSISLKSFSKASANPAISIPSSALPDSVKMD